MIENARRVNPNNSKNCLILDVTLYFLQNKFEIVIMLTDVLMLNKINNKIKLNIATLNVILLNINVNAIASNTIGTNIPNPNIGNIFIEKILGVFSINLGDNQLHNNHITVTNTKSASKENKKSFNKLVFSSTIFCV